MNKKRDPRKRKEESLNHDRRNTYGENDKSSRKSIRRRKQLVNQIYRHKVKQTLAANDTDSAEDRVTQIRRPNWKKSPDQPLGKVLLEDLLHDIRTFITGKSIDSTVFEHIEELMEDDGWEKTAIHVVMRQLRGASTNHWSGKLNIDLKIARKLILLFEQVKSENSSLDQIQNEGKAAHY